MPSQIILISLELKQSYFIRRVGVPDVYMPASSSAKGACSYSCQETKGMCASRLISSHQFMEHFETKLSTEFFRSVMDTSR